jgi:hypothetical protein
MPWSAEIAMLDMWREMDKNVTNGVMQKFFRRHLQAAFDAGEQQERARCCRIADEHRKTLSNGGAINACRHIEMEIRRVGEG